MKKIKYFNKSFMVPDKCGRLNLAPMKFSFVFIGKVKIKIKKER